jgi:type II secretion system protein G
MKKAFFERGITLIELLLVISVLGILATGALAVLNPIEQIQKSSDAKRKTELTQIQRALELYYQDAGRYPTSSTNYRITVGATTYNWGTPWQPYISRLPSDPSSGRSYVYYSPNGQTYYLYANLERGNKDTQACNSGNACTSLSGAGFPSSNACGGICNFGVSSPNVTP